MGDGLRSAFPEEKKKNLVTYLVLLLLLMHNPNVLAEDKKRCGVRPSRAEKTCPYAQASIFKRRTSVAYPVSREHVKALNVSVHLYVDKKVTQTVPPPPHVTLDCIKPAVTHFQQPLPT